MPRSKETVVLPRRIGNAGDAWIFWPILFCKEGLLLSTTLSFLALSLVHSVIRRPKEADFNFRMQRGEGDDDTSLTIQLRKSSGEERGIKRGTREESREF